MLIHCSFIHLSRLCYLFFTVWIGGESIFKRLLFVFNQWLAQAVNAAVFPVFGRRSWINLDQSRQLKATWAKPSQAKQHKARRLTADEHIKETAGFDWSLSDTSCRGCQHACKSTLTFSSHIPVFNSHVESVTCFS